MSNTSWFKGMAKPEGSGRKKDSVTKVQKSIQERLKQLNCDPIEGMARIALLAEEAGEYAIAVACYKELAQYIAPKLRAIEHSGTVDGGITVQIVKFSEPDAPSAEWSNF
jgi:hypothetical protein